MNIYLVPEDLEGIIFDIDQTLYRHDEYYFEQTEVQIKHLASLLGKELSSLKEEIRQYKELYQREHEGRNPSLGTVFNHLYAIDILTSAQWRSELIHPENHLEKDPHLKRTLKTLAETVKIAAVTNNSSTVGWKTLDILNVREEIPFLVGLDQSLVSKPHEKPFLMACSLMNLLPEQVLCIGDRFEIDVELPLKLGMGGILVDSMEDIHSLPSILRSR